RDRRVGQLGHRHGRHARSENQGDGPGSVLQHAGQDASFCVLDQRNRRRDLRHRSVHAHLRQSSRRSFQVRREVAVSRVWRLDQLPAILKALSSREGMTEQTLRHFACGPNLALASHPATVEPFLEEEDVMQAASKWLVIGALCFGLVPSAFATGPSPAQRYRQQRGSTSIQSVTTYRNASRSMGYSTSANLDGTVTSSKVRMYRGGGETILSTKNLGKSAQRAATSAGFTHVQVGTGRKVVGHLPNGTVILGSQGVGITERGNVRMSSDQGDL